jgi:S-DNA-T family DNA segregation ATPase FtsK/SpoIIIE
MTTQELLGKVAAQYLRDRLAEDGEVGTARYLLDCLTASQTAAVAKAVLADTTLSALVEIKLPRHFMEGHGLPEDLLTVERTTYYRNANCIKSALLVANVGDDEEQSLKELIPIGAPQLLNHSELWVTVAAHGLALPEEHEKWWRQSLKGLAEARSVSLERYAEYVALTRRANKDLGHTIRNALGYALPALHIPRDTNLFNALNDKTAGHVSRWKKIYLDAFKKRSCYLVKQTPAQVLLDAETLLDGFEKTRDDIPAECHLIIDAFIPAPSGWNDQAMALAECEWEFIKPLFDGLKREKFNLGQATLDFYDQWDAELLSDDDRDYLTRLIARKTTQPEDEDEQFYQSHRLELKDNPSLKAKWDRFIYGAPIETEDFVSGIAQCLQALFDQDQQSSERKLRIISDKRNPKELKQLNRDAGLFFSFRYRGLKELLGRSASWDVGKLFSFQDLDELWINASKPFRNRSVAKAALQIKFYLELEVKLSHGTNVSYSKQLIWKFNPNTISSELYPDWERLVKNPLIRCEAQRELVSGKGRFQSIDLENVQTLMPSYDKDRGSLVPVYQKENDVSKLWPVNITQAILDNRISPDTGTYLLSLFGNFAEKYNNAVSGFWTGGLSDITLFTDQLSAYSELMVAICKRAKGDRNRETLLRLILDIGSVPISGGPVASIVAPWHPLRLAAMANKALQVTSLIRHLVTADSIFFGDTKLYFEEVEAELAHPFYPELILGWRETKPELLSLADYHLDYSLHEPPVVQQDAYADTNEDPKACASRVIDVLKRYLALHPHEQANLSVVLYNCDSARLPQTIVDKIQELHEDDGDMRCQVVLRHREGAKLRELYERIIESTDSDADSFVASEATRDFMARLRIGIMADEAPAPDDADGPPTDVVFLQDVIARHAQLEWYPEPARPVSWNEWVPPRWSRRRPAASDDLKSVVYLCCPVASQEGWSYLTAITTFLKGDWDENEAIRLLPARQLNFNDPTTASIFKEIHNLGNWVVNYDELLDRRQLVNQHVKVIRYKQTETQGRNMLISSNCSTALLNRMVLKRLEGLTLGLEPADLNELARRLINEANMVSGDLVLRAAKRGRNASELIGVVLSKYLIQREVGDGRYFGWYFLDDYADWLGQKEEQIADILALSPEEAEDGSKRLAVVISESKFIDHASLSVKRKESQKQLRQTLDRIAKALFGDPGRLDRDIWLSRFSDMVLNGIHFPANAQLQLSEWRRAIRDGECDIYLRGYSHVFVSGPTDCPECSDFALVAETDDAYQEVFSRQKLRQLLIHYHNSSDPVQVRKDIADQDVWTEKLYKRPSDRITTLVKVPPVSTNKNIAQSGDETKTAPPSGGNGNSKPKKNDILEETNNAAAVNRPKPGDNGGATVVNLFTCDNADIWTVTADTDDEIAWLKNTESRTKGALQQFQLQSKLLTSKLTPNAALLKFQGSAQLTVEQVLRRRSEFLTTHGLKLISVRAEPGAVALAVSRPSRKVLDIREVWSQWKPDLANGNQELLIGVKEDDGSLLMYSPKKNAPHALIAGTTGSGKSVLMQNIVLSIAATNTPDQAKLIIIDPKQVDYLAFTNLPHIADGIVDDQLKAVSTLEKLVQEMDRRYAVMKANRVTNIFDLLAKQEATERPPVLWVIHDEFAEWMLTDAYKDNVANIVSRLGVKARAAGIFLFFAAQRPDASVMPMQLRSNLGNRLILRVDGEGTSEIALGEKGAEQLLGKGHMAAKLEGEADLIYAQVPFVSPTQIDELVANIVAKYGVSS